MSERTLPELLDALVAAVRTHTKHGCFEQDITNTRTEIILRFNTPTGIPVIKPVSEWTRDHYLALQQSAAESVTPAPDPDAIQP